MLRDFSECHLSGCYYGGTKRKTGIVLDGEKYIIKFPGNSSNGYSYHHVSEYLGSQIFDMLGIVAQDTWLGTYEEEEVVVLKDFVLGSEYFVPFDDLVDCFLDLNDRRRYGYRDMIDMLKMKIEPDGVEEIIDGFWDMFTVDTLIGNFERHGRNWGFIKKGGKYTAAPVFGNDSCLFPEIVSDEQCLELLRSKEKMEQRIFRSPALRILFDGTKSSFSDIIISQCFPECDRALWRIIKKIDLTSLHALVNGVEFMSDIRKKFILTVLEERYKRLLLEPFERMM